MEQKRLYNVLGGLLGYRLWDILATSEEVRVPRDYLMKNPNHMDEMLHGEKTKHIQPIWQVVIKPSSGEWGFPDGSEGEESACRAGDTGDAGLIPGLGRSPWGRNSYPLQYSCLENSMDRGVWQVKVHRVAKSRTQLYTADSWGMDLLILSIPAFATWMMGPDLIWALSEFLAPQIMSKSLLLLKDNKLGGLWYATINTRTP